MKSFSYFLILFCIMFSSCWENHAPEIKSVKLTPQQIEPGGKVQIEVEIYDEDHDSLSFTYQPEAGTVYPSKSSLPKSTWTVPSQAGEYEITIIVSDGEKEVSAKVKITVIEKAGKVKINVTWDK